MSVLFPKVNKPREWDYRPIYFDEKKEARKDKRLAFWLVLLGLLLFAFYFLF